jgi:hypothetical protein
MTRFLGAVLATTLLSAPGGLARADDKDTKAILDKAIKAAGGEAKLGKLEAFTWKTKGTITINDTDNPYTSQATVQGLDRFRSEFDAELGGDKIKGATVLNKTKGWRKFGDMGGEMDKDALANEKRSVYLQVVPITLVPLKGKGFKVETAGEMKVGGKAAVGLKVTGPDGKDFKLYFDKDTGLPVKLVAKVVGFMGEEVNQETTYGAYKEFGGIKKATKIEAKRDGKKFLTGEITAFKALTKVDPKTFDEPK